MRPTMLVLLLLAACSVEPPPPPRPPRPPAPPVAPEPPLAPSVATLAGEWRIAGIDGKPFDEPYGLALSGDAQEIWWASRCAGLIRSYRITGSSIRIGPAKRPSDAVCAIGLPPRIDEVTRAIDSATAIRRTPSNGVEISGGGRSLLLFSQ